MSLSDKISTSIKEAMKAKDQVALRSLRAIKSAILLELTKEGASDELTEETEISMVQKLVKQRKDSLEIYEKQGRADLAEKEKEEIEIISQFLPEQLSESELKEKVASIISDSGASSMKDMGKVMGLASKALAGKADGKAISTIVKELLSA